MVFGLEVLHIPGRSLLLMLRANYDTFQFLGSFCSALRALGGTFGKDSCRFTEAL